MDNELSQRLVKARSGHGWSQADLAEVSGVAAAQISRYEAGRSKPRTEVVAKLARALAVSFEWLLDGQGDIEAREDVPIHPSGMHKLGEIELNSELLALAEKFAKLRGITLEMALHTMVSEAIDRMAEDPTFLESVAERAQKHKLEP